MSNKEKIEKSEVYKRVINDSFGGVMYNVDNYYPITESRKLIKLWDEMSESDKELSGGIMKGAIGFLEQQVKKEEKLTNSNKNIKKYYEKEESKNTTKKSNTKKQNTMKKESKKTSVNKTQVKKKNKRVSVNSLLESNSKKDIGLGMVYKVKENLSNRKKDPKEKRALTRKMNIIKKAFDTNKMTEVQKNELHKKFLNGFKRSMTGKVPTKSDMIEFNALFESFKSLGNNPTKKKDPKKQMNDVLARLGMK